MQFNKTVTFLKLSLALTSFALLPNAYGTCTAAVDCAGSKTATCAVTEGGPRSGGNYGYEGCPDNETCTARGKCSAIAAKKSSCTWEVLNLQGTVRNTMTTYICCNATGSAITTTQASDCP